MSYLYSSRTFKSEQTETIYNGNPIKLNIFSFIKLPFYTENFRLKKNLYLVFIKIKGIIMAQTVAFLAAAAAAALLQLYLHDSVS